MAKKLKVISANYRDRTSPYKWLVRDQDQDPKQAVAFKTVKAKGVTFEGSNSYESGFGCQMVAVAESVEVGGAENAPVRIKFNGSGFVYEGDYLEKVKELELSEDGSMVAVL